MLQVITQVVPEHVAFRDITACLGELQIRLLNTVKIHNILNACNIVSSPTILTLFTTQRLLINCSYIRNILNVLNALNAISSHGILIILIF